MNRIKDINNSIAELKEYVLLNDLVIRIDNLDDNINNADDMHNMFITIIEKLNIISCKLSELNEILNEL